MYISINVEGGNKPIGNRLITHPPVVANAMEEITIPLRRSEEPLTISAHDGQNAMFSIGSLIIHGDIEINMDHNASRAIMRIGDRRSANVFMHDHVARRLDVWLSHHLDDYVASTHEATLSEKTMSSHEYVAE
jgi:hypothetical protein